ncbi:triose-phosphate transporter family-domain-containing protein [Fimicolochytrium jonesii]|uniref:triose-phosphate transporter family-domain-containing protein n=1 Tax=Fimicolochytrium jonesii TaxID=1396493 RepID=UPI0022FF1596|nr:triose-phosphate transporter family-domain-containing protein [Fimicolochytrium jonesii]KAI8824505.1 triose-phosphate transporter family-domain-containing protein [Fimicolochytrium jonesii]
MTTADVPHSVDDPRRLSDGSIPDENFEKYLSADDLLSPIGSDFGSPRASEAGRAEHTIGRFSPLPWVFKNLERCKSLLGGDGLSPFAKQWLRQALKAGFYILSWYTFSLTISFYNTWLFHEDQRNFRFPLFTTTLHMLMQFSLSAIAVIFVWPKLRPKRYPAMKDYLTKVLPCGVSTGMDIGLSNSSLKLITLSFYTMVKSGAPVFVLLFAFLFKLERPTWSLSAVIAVICLGVLLMVVNEGQFRWVGYLEVQTATVMSGLRWALTQILLERESMGMNNPLAASLFLAPIMGLSLLVACMAIEGLPTILTSPDFATFGSTMGILGILCGGGVIAFFMVVSEFFLISTTSIVTFSVAGIFKEILTLVGAKHVYGDEFPPNKIVGLIISISGIAFYNYLRISGMRKKHRKEARKGGGLFAEAERERGETGDAADNVADATRGLLYGFHPVTAMGSPLSMESDLDMPGYDDIDLGEDDDDGLL